MIRETHRVRSSVVGEWGMRGFNLQTLCTQAVEKLDAFHSLLGLAGQPLFSRIYKIPDSPREALQYLSEIEP